MRTQSSMRFCVERLSQVPGGGARRMFSTIPVIVWHAIIYPSERQSASLLACGQGSNQGPHPSFLQSSLLARRKKTPDNDLALEFPSPKGKKNAGQRPCIGVPITKGTQSTTIHITSAYTYEYQLLVNPKIWQKNQEDIPKTR